MRLLAAIDTAEAGTDDNGAPKLTLRLTDEATPVFAEFSADHVGEYLALALDYEVLMTPDLGEAITVVWLKSRRRRTASIRTCCGGSSRLSTPVVRSARSRPASSSRSRSSKFRQARP